jgi:hypothetical protein
LAPVAAQFDGIWLQMYRVLLALEAISKEAGTEITVNFAE